MPLQEVDNSSLSHLITGYEPGIITVNKNRQYQHSILISTDSGVSAWSPQRNEELTPAHFSILAQQKPPLLIIGTGATQHAIAHDLLSDLYQARIGLEIMSTPAACRTFTLLATEGHHCTAALLIR